MPTHTARIFNALPHPPTITHTTRGHTHVTLTLPVTTAATHMTGHYPGFPILPGVLMIDTIRQTTSTALNTELNLHTINHARFTRPLLPGDELHLTLTIQPTPPNNPPHNSVPVADPVGNPATDTTSGTATHDRPATGPDNDVPVAGPVGNPATDSTGGTATHDRPATGPDNDAPGADTTGNPDTDTTGGAAADGRRATGPDNGVLGAGPVGGRVTVTAHATRADGLPAAQLTLTLAPAVTHA